MHVYRHMYLHMLIYEYIYRSLTYGVFLDPHLLKVKAVCPLGTPGISRRHTGTFQKALIVNLHAFHYQIRNCNLTAPDGRG